uniref:1-acyl-sn-glycerol-3-phosphate acyltransferase n=1 Tax=Strigamia maritima TaxID=126957 RepID=T1JAZ9_STRMM
MARVMNAVLRYASDISFKVQGLKYLKSCKGSAILVANHQSSFDGFGFSQFWLYVHPCSFVAKNTMAYFGPMGFAVTLCGVVFINRANSKKAMAQLDYQYKQLYDRNSKLLIFPEGTRNFTGTILPFKKGAFCVAIKHQVPIIPIVYSSQIEYFNVRKRFWYNKDMIIRVLPAIPTTGLTLSDVEQLSNSVRELMMKTFEQISK